MKFSSASLSSLLTIIIHFSLWFSLISPSLLSSHSGQPSSVTWLSSIPDFSNWKCRIPLEMQCSHTTTALVKERLWEKLQPTGVFYIFPQYLNSTEF